MRMIIVGPPGSGKGTQAARLVERFQIPHISTGDMFRAEAQSGSERGKELQKSMSSGGLVPDDLVIAMTMDRLSQPDCKDGFMLDGFPRTLPQAKALEAALGDAGLKLDVVLLIEVADELVEERITGRRQDPVTGIIYHLTFDPPPTEVADRVIQREDDTPEKCRKRLEKYHSETVPIIPFYDERGLLKRVDGEASPNAVAERIERGLVTAREGSE